MTREERITLMAWRNNRQQPWWVRQRAEILLEAIVTPSSRLIARRHGISATTVRSTRLRFQQSGLESLHHGAPYSGRKATRRNALTPLILARMRTPPGIRARWSTYSLARALGLSQSMVQRVWVSEGIQPAARGRTPKILRHVPRCRVHFEQMTRTRVEVETSTRFGRETPSRLAGGFPMTGGQAMRWRDSSATLFGQGRRGNQAAFTLVELLVVVAIISVLAAMLMPALNKAVMSSRQVACTNTLKQLGMSFASYAEENQNYLPNPNTNRTPNDARWCNAIREHLNQSYGLLCCPSSTNPKTGKKTLSVINSHLYGKPDYGYNVNLYYRPPLSTPNTFDSASGPVYLKTSQIRKPTQVVLTGDAESPAFGVNNNQYLYPYAPDTLSDWGGKMTYRHNLGGTYVYAAGNADWRNTQLAALNWLAMFSPSGQ